MTYEKVQFVRKLIFGSHSQLVDSGALGMAADQTHKITFSYIFCL